MFQEYLLTFPIKESHEYFYHEALDGFEFGPYCYVLNKGRVNLNSNLQMQISLYKKLRNTFDQCDNHQGLFTPISVKIRRKNHSGYDEASK